MLVLGAHELIFTWLKISIIHVSKPILLIPVLTGKAFGCWKLTFSPDHDYLVFVWTSVEPCMGIIGACLPSIRPIFRGFSPESLVGSIRSAFSLHSIGSRNNMRRDGVKLDDSHPLRKTSEDGDVSSKNFGIANVQKPAPSYQVTQDFELHSLDETK